MGAVLERFYAVLDCNGNGTIELDEFMHARFLLEHIPRWTVYQDEQTRQKLSEEFRLLRLKFIFNLFDLNYDGIITQKELRKVLPVFLMGNTPVSEEDQELLAPLADAAAHFAIQKFDVKRRNGLEWLDFRRFARTSDVVQSIVDLVTPDELSFPKD